MTIRRALAVAMVFALAVVLEPSSSGRASATGNSGIYNVTAFGAIADDSLDDGAAIAAAIAAVPVAGGQVYFPSGVYRISSPIVTKPNLWLNGDGANTSVIMTTADIDGIRSIYPINSSTAAHEKITDLQLLSTNPTPTKAGIDQVGGSFVAISNVAVTGFRFGIIFDQTELADIDLCDIEAQRNNGAAIWLVNGPDHTPGAWGQMTNRISVTRCQINQAGWGIGIADDGGTAHQFSRVNFNGGTIQLRLAAADGVLVESSEFESANIAIKSTYTTAFTGAGAGQSVALNILANQITGTYGLWLDDGSPVVVMGNIFQTPNVAITGWQNCYSFTEFGNVQLGGSALK